MTDPTASETREVPASAEPVEKPREGFLRAVWRQVFDVRPAALVASLLQFGIVYWVGSALFVVCANVPSHLTLYCKPGAFEFVGSALPSIVFWGVAILLSVFLLLLVPIAWFSIPAVLVLIALYLASFLPSPLSTIGAVGGVGFVIWIWYKFVHKVTGVPPDGGRRPDIHEL